MPPRAIKRQLTCPIELTSGSFLIGRRGILVIPRNRLVIQHLGRLSSTAELCKSYLGNAELDWPDYMQE